MDDDEMELHGKASGLIIWYVGLAAALIIGLGLLAAWLKPVWLGFERDAFVASHQYQEGHLDQLNRLREKKAELEVKKAESQDSEIKAALSNQIQAIKTRIQTEERKLNQ